MDTNLIKLGFHADHGSVYTSKDYAAACARHGVLQSMGAVGSSADNALAESFNATMKRETLAGAHAYDGPRHARRTVFRWINHYNQRRRHSRCGYTSPITYETTTTATLRLAA
ncbi:hypothetical protein ET471_01635 [Xylanimonas protaetiae]|uniref:Integrase catalytic domain-containing protein n=1 Tax=Xylanimonas protaetiae TaxID=2509457 RepID=A0A4P6F0F3_9MICO|nr:hypothetical protein ET471_01635 [Xylanimonas protaetiae]